MVGKEEASLMIAGLNQPAILFKKYDFIHRSLNVLKFPGTEI